jgi:UDP-N-acetyl-2-amino-2-deoxyglucuronate dehydrogenase
MNGARIRTGVIGCGKVGRIHADVLRDLPGSRFAGCVGRDPDKTAAFAREFGVPAFASVEEMARSGVEAVVVCTPHPLHADAAVRAAGAGMHVLVEKPLAASLADCDRMLAAAEANRVVLATVSQRRFFEPCQRIRRAIDEGRIGTPILGTVTMLGCRREAYYRSDPWRGSWGGEGGGVLVNQAPHQLDLLLWFLGPVEEVYGTWANLNHPYIEVDDTAAAVVRFRSGALATILVTNSLDPALFGKVHVHGSTGASVGVQTDGGAMFIAGLSKVEEPPLNDLWTVKGEEDRLEAYRREDEALFRTIDPIRHYVELQDADFLRAVAEGVPPLVDGSAGRATVELFTAIYRSNRDRTPVRFPLATEG